MEVNSSYNTLFLSWEKRIMVEAQRLKSLASKRWPPSLLCFVIRQEQAGFLRGTLTPAWATKLLAHTAFPVRPSFYITH